MVAKQRIRMANEKHSKNITLRGNVAKSTVSLTTAAQSCLWTRTRSDQVQTVDWDQTGDQPVDWDQPGVRTPVQTGDGPVSV
ncbi:hypothetical protein ABVT39_000234 [Epinephelus coioides]